MSAFAKGLALAKKCGWESTVQQMQDLIKEAITSRTAAAQEDRTPDRRAARYTSTWRRKAPDDRSGFSRYPHMQGPCTSAQGRKSLAHGESRGR